MTLTTAVLDWADLTPAQTVQLLTTPDRVIDTTGELLDFNLNLLQRDVPLLGGGVGNVHWLGSAQIHRDASFSLAGEYPWGTSILRLRQRITDRYTGLSAARYLGAFCLHTPEQVLGSGAIRLPSGELALPYDVTGQDRLYLLLREVGHSYYIAGGGSVLEALATVYSDAGVTGFRIDSTRDDATIPSDGMAWPLIVRDPNAKRAWNGMRLPDRGSSDPTTWLTIINDLHRLISYRGVWADESGFYRSEPYVNPADRGSSFDFDATALVRGSVGLARSRSLDLWKAPNKWTLIRSNMPTGTAPTLIDGIVQDQNDDDGPSSINARGGGSLGTWPVTLSVEAADQDALEALLAARIADDKRASATYAVETVPFPAASHFDVFTYNEPSFGTTKVQADEWTVDLWGANTSWVWSST